MLAFWGVSQVIMVVFGSLLMVKSLGFYPSLSQPFSSFLPLSCTVRIWITECQHLACVLKLLLHTPLKHCVQTTIAFCIILRPRSCLGRKNRPGERDVPSLEMCLRCLCSGPKHSKSGVWAGGVLLALLEPHPLEWSWFLEGRIDVLEHGGQGGIPSSQFKG